MVEKKANPNRNREGDVYLTSTGTAYREPIVTSAKLKQYSKNFYGAGVARKLLALFFGKLEIYVEDQDGNKNEDLQKELELMTSAREISLFSKMKIAWLDRFWQGMSFFNPVWIQDGTTWKLKELRRLPPESFSRSPEGVSIVFAGKDSAVQGDILRGVVAMPDGTLRYFQSTQTGIQTELTKIYTIKDSMSPEVAGEPEILPVVPVLTMLDFAWKAQIQKTNRTGAPVLLLRIINAKADDVAYGEKLIKNWGSDTGFILRSNMEIVDFNPYDSETALETINKLMEMVIDYWVPTSMLSKNGQLIGGNSNSDLNLLYSYIAGQHREIEAEWEPLLQIYLDANGYEDYRVKLRLEDPQIDDSQIKLEQAKVGSDTGLLTENEVRARLGAEEMSEEELAELPIRKKEQKEEERAAREEEKARMQAEAIKAGAGQQPPGQAPGQAKTAPGQAGQAPGQKAPKAPQAAPKGEDPKGKGKGKEGPYQFKQSQHTHPGGDLWPDEGEEIDDENPDGTAARLIKKEEKELNQALDALSKAVLAKL